MKYLKTLLTSISSAALLLAFPLVSFAAYTAGWTGTSTGTNFIFPTLINGIQQTVQANNFLGTSTTAASNFTLLGVGSSTPFGKFGVVGTTTIKGNLLITRTGEVPTYNDSNLSLMDIVDNVNSYTFVGLQNKNNGVSASSDFVWGNDRTTTSTYYADCGVASSNYADPVYTLFAPNDGYCFVTDGALNLGTGTTTASSVIKFFTGGYAVANEKMRITQAGNVGIGSTTPSSKLDVAGFINTDQYSGFKQAGNTILYASTTNKSILVGQSAGSALLPDGIQNTAVGYEALKIATSTDFNTAIGYQTLMSDIEGGTHNTAVGNQALKSNTTGSDNTASGYTPMAANTTGAENAAYGSYTLNSNTSGGRNVAMGYAALTVNTTGGSNTALGYRALRYGLTTAGITAIGYQAGTGPTNITDYNSWNDSYMTFIGYNASRANTVASTSALTNSTAIGYNATVGGSNMMALGGTGAYAVNVGIGTTTPSGTLAVEGTVFLNGLTTSTAGNSVCQLTGGQIVNAGGTTCVTSSRRFKTDIKPIDIGLKEVLALNPKSYTRKEPTQSMPTGKEVGLIAEEVEKVIPRIVEYEADGVTPRGVNYQEYTAVLTKAIQEQQKQIDALKAEVKALKK